RDVATDARSARPFYRSGIVLVLVLVFAALIAIAGFSAMEANSTAYPEAMNLRAAARARNAAASGIAMASHYLHVPPTSVAVGNYWTGTTGISIDGSYDTCDITLARSGSVPQNYSVTATGYARDADGALRGQQTITSD